MTYLSDCARADGSLIEFLEHLFNRLLKDLFDYSLGMREMMSPSAGVQCAHAFAQHCRKEVCTRSCPLRQLFRCVSNEFRTYIPDKNASHKA